jgi:hypothetical protein
MGRGGPHSLRGQRGHRGSGRVLGSSSRIVSSIFAVVCLLAPLSIPAEPERELAKQEFHSVDRFRILPAVRLDLVRPVELVPSGSFAVAFDGHNLSGTHISSQLLRTLPTLWQIDLAGSTPVAYHAQYELMGADGRPGGLSLTAGDGFMPVTLEPIAPTLSRGMDGSARLEGGLKLHLSLDGVTRSGNYRGTLIVTLHGL